MARLGGSPLGIIGLLSGPRNGLSTFPGGGTRNVNVNSYNRSEAGSLFSGKRRLRAWPNLKGTKSTSYKYDEKGNKTDTVDFSEQPDTTGLSTVFKNEKGEVISGYVSNMGTSGAVGSNLLHNNDVYDTSVLNLVEKLAGTTAQLRPSDFAYLKDLGVYPNNRLMIARRFLGSIGDNIMTKSTTRMGASATLISWRPEGDDFLEIQFGEEWGPAKADFTGILTQIGDDFMKGGAGKIAGAAANILPLPGFTEIFQRQFLIKLGLLDEGAATQIPSGNPNLIKEAKVRKTVGYSEAGSGLMCKVTIKMVCEYELKFISGIDPTMVWMDLLGTILRFGTSESSNYGLSAAVGAKLAKWASSPKALMNDIITSVQGAIQKAQKAITKAIQAVYDAATNEAREIQKKSEEAEKDKETEGTDGTGPKTPESEKIFKEAKEMAAKAKAAGANLLDKLVQFAAGAIRGTILKYRVEMMGIVSSLTGAPSTPWHITIGNPLRPVFCSGDMLTTEVTLKLGSTLAFNDLPSSITVEFSLTNARSWGLQEIMAKFNSGYLRTVDVQKSYFETSVKISKNKNVEEVKEEEAGSMFEKTVESSTTYTGKTPSVSPTITGASPSITPGLSPSGTGPKTDQQTKLEGDQKAETEPLSGNNSLPGGKEVTGLNPSEGSFGSFGSFGTTPTRPGV